MSLTEHQLISKVLDEDGFVELYKYNINRNDFYTLPDVYDFVKDYVDENGSSPDYRTVVSEFETFEYMPEVADKFNYLARKLKSTTAKREAINVLQGQASAKFNELDGLQFAEWLHEQATRIKDVSQAESYTGLNYATTGKERWERYVESKDSRTHKFVPTPYDSLTNYLGGGFEIGDYVLLQAYTNRGKSWIASHCGVTAWKHGHGVLHYSPELSLVQQEQRNDTLIGHFDNTGLKKGNVRNEDKYKEFLDTEFSAHNETPYIIKTMEHLPKGLSLDVIEADLQANPEIDFMIIDGFNLISHKGKSSNRDNMSNTSRKLRQLFSRYQVVGILVHQTPTSAEKENKEDDDTGARIVKPPELDQYSETIAVIQDASTILSYDFFDGVGKIKLAKSRTPNVNAEITLHANYNEGFIQERTILDDI